MKILATTILSLSLMTGCGSAINNLANAINNASGSGKASCTKSSSSDSTTVACQGSVNNDNSGSSGSSSSNSSNSSVNSASGSGSNATVITTTTSSTSSSSSTTTTTIQNGSQSQASDLSGSWENDCDDGVKYLRVFANGIETVTTYLYAEGTCETLKNTAVNTYAFQVVSDGMISLPNNMVQAFEIENNVLTFSNEMPASMSEGITVNATDVYKRIQ